MTSNEGHPAGPDEEKYEATVLDFLDREMAAVQPGKPKDQQLDELDALVTDLLKQVITESDQPQDGSKLLEDNKPLFDDQDELFSGLKSKADTLPEATAKIAEPKPEAEAKPKPESPAPQITRAVEDAPAAKKTKPEEAPVKTEATPKVKKSDPAPIPAFASAPAVSSKKMPVLAAAVAALVLVIGAAVYFFSKSSGKASSQPASQPAVAQLAKDTSPAATPVSHPAPSAAAPAAQEKSAAPTPAKPARVESSNKQNAPAAATPKSAAAPQPAKTAAVTAKPELKPAPVVSTPPPPVKEEKPAIAQPQPAPPAPVAAAVEKPAPAPENTPSNPVPAEKKVAAPTPPPVTVAETPAPAPQPAAPAPRNLVLATPLSQASPAYPELALRTRSSGSVVLELQIDEQGKVVKATPVNGPSIFHNAAVAAAMKWRYKPASIGGVNVRSQSRITMDFNLKK